MQLLAHVTARTQSFWLSLCTEHEARICKPNWRQYEMAVAHVHEDAVRRDADLPRVHEARAHDRISGSLEVSIVKDNEGGVATELHADALDSCGCALHQVLACRSKTPLLI